jgi:two-component sensor histidine kinase
MASKFQMEIADMTHQQSLLPLSGTVHSVPFVELGQPLPSQVKAISPFVDQFVSLVLNFRNADGSEVEIEMALCETLANAVIHGNRENSYKRVFVECRCYMDGEVAITIRDEGAGFDRNTVPDRVWYELCLHIQQATRSRR